MTTALPTRPASRHAPRWALALVLAATGAAHAATASPLAAAGYAVLPAPQRVTLSGSEFAISDAWRMKVAPGIPATDIAIETLTDELATRHGLRLSPADQEAAKTIELAVRADAVDIGPALDRDRDVLAREAYRIDLGEQGIRITANAEAGLFYGVETLCQLIKPRNGGLWLPAGEIADWPDLQLRSLYWDDAHHLERFAALKRAIRTAAFFKMNGFVLKLEGHFQFRSAPALVEPYALTEGEYQALTDYGLRYHVQVIPYLDAPAHIAFILKHPEYAGLRAFADSNYELNVVNPESCALLFGMYQDLIDANKGGRYFFLSTDEAYYVGLSADPRHPEAARMKELGSPGKVLGEFMHKAAGYLHERGRTVVFWGEHPMVPADVPAFPDFLVSGETNPEFDAAFKAHGIRQLFFVSTEGEERLFPDYAGALPERMLHRPANDAPRVAAAIAAIQADPARRTADLLGAVVAGWADSGLHPETFWLGYATIAAAAWNPAGTEALGASADFYRLFYGPSSRRIDHVYQLLSTQAQFWSDSWEPMPSRSRKGIWGSSHSIFPARHDAHDETLPLPIVPQALGPDVDAQWPLANARRLELAAKYRVENDELCALLHENLLSAEFNHDNLEVLLSVAALCRQNLDLILGIGRMNGSLAAAQKAFSGNEPAQVVAELDQALAIARQILHDRDATLADTVDTWYKSWQPRVLRAHGRTFLHDLDDVKDHLPDRTVGMEYLMLREYLLPLGAWVGQLQAMRNSFARSHQLPVRDDPFSWNDQGIGALSPP
jgi:hexosaminidase